MTGTAAFLGQDIAVALRVYEQHVNRTGGIRGRPLQFVVSDDTSSPQVAVQVATQLFAKRPIVILGSAGVGTCSAVAPLTDAGPVMYCLSPGFNPSRGSYAFAASISSDYLIPVSIRYVRLRGLLRIAFITATDASGLAADRIAQADLMAPENSRMRMIADEHFAPTDINVSAQVARIKAGDPQVIVVLAVGSPFVTVLRALRDAGLQDVAVIANPANMNATFLTNNTTVMAKELLFPGLRYQAGDRLRSGPLKAATDEFIKAYRDARSEPTTLSAYAWDPARIVVEALRALPPDPTAAQLRAYLASLHGFVGLNGVYDFRSGDQHGLTDTAAIMVRWAPQTGAFVAVSEAGGKPFSSGGAQR